MTPDFSTLAEAVFLSYPEDVAALRKVCDATDELRKQGVSEDDPRVQAGVVDANNRKGQFTRRIAWACYQHDSRLGLRKKTVGGIATRPADGLTHATDVLMMSDDGQIIDVMSDRNVSWGVTAGDRQPRDQWVKPLPPEGEVVPAPPVIPDSEQTALAALQAQVAKLERQRDAMQAQADGHLDLILAQNAALERCEARVEKLENRPSPMPAPFVLPPLVAIGKIRIGWLNYDLRLPVEKA